MVQHSRIEKRSLIYYINAKGKRGQKIFLDDLDKLHFKNLLQQQKIKGALNIYCFVLMQKQYSLLVEVYKNNLSKSIHWINSVYANYFNRRHNFSNKLFKDHYTCIIIEKKQYLAELSCQIHLMPKKDKISESLFQYDWSTLPGYINRKKREDWVNYDCILSMFNEKNNNASLNYQKYIKNSLKEQIVSPFENLKGKIILGSEDFKKKVLKIQYLDKMSSPRDKDVLAKKILELVAHSPSWSSLRIKKKNSNQTILPRNAAIYFLKKYTDLSNQQISTYFKSLKKSSISQMSRRYNLIKEKYIAIKRISTSLEEKIKILL